MDLIYGHKPDCSHCGGTGYVSIYYAKDVDPLLRAAALDATRLPQGKDKEGTGTAR